MTDKPDTQTRLLLLSSSRTPGTEFLEHAQGHIREFLGTTVRRVLFVPFATVLWSHEEMTARAAGAFSALGYEIAGLHAAADPVAAIRQAEAIAVGGGNTFRLLQELQARKLLDALRSRVLAGTPYIGWSAGSNLACPTIRTTNDMPIVWPEQPGALNLVPFQINPHYTDVHDPDHQGETREDRLQEFMLLNPGVTVVGLREGSALLLEQGRLRLLGSQSARLFRGGQVAEVKPDASLQFLLQDGPLPTSI
jgi:dipeptidase E